MARLTIAWVKEYAKTNGIFLVKTSNGYCVQYQRLIDELTYEDSVGYKEVFKTLKETKDWIDDQNPVDVLGIDEEVAKEIYEDAKNFSDKVDRDMGVDREEENYNIPELDPRYDGKFWNVESIGMSYQEDYTPLEWYEKLIKTGRDKHAEWWLNQHPEIKEVKTPLETYVNDVVSREKWILSLTEDELDNSGLSDQEVSFWVKNQNKSEENKEEVGKMQDTYYSESLVKEEVKEEKEFTLTDDNKSIIRAIVELDPAGHNGFLLDLTPTKGKYLPALVDVMDAVKTGELLRGEFCDLPLPKSLKITPTHKLISLANGELTMVKDFKLSAIAKLPFKFIGVDENKLCFELEDGVAQI